jgi:hypothetical protein
MASRLNDFPELVRQRLAERAAYLCSRPDCRRLTIGPHTEPDKSRSTGVAAHICAAASGGPRSDLTMTSRQIKAISNGIWLCQQCSRLVDTDWKDWPREQFYRWREQHERFVKTLGELGIKQAMHEALASVDERAVARRLLTLLGDRRFLYTLFDYEVPRHVLESIQMVRSELRTISSTAPDGSKVKERAESLLRVCRTFLQDSGDLNDDRPLFGGREPDRAEVFRDQLAIIRKMFGVHVQALSTEYSIPIPEELKGIVPEQASSA